jgi:hypothetical protein
MLSTNVRFGGEHLFYDIINPTGGRKKIMKWPHKGKTKHQFFTYFSVSYTETAGILASQERLGMG